MFVQLKGFEQNRVMDTKYNRNIGRRDCELAVGATLSTETTRGTEPRKISMYWDSYIDIPAAPRHLHMEHHYIFLASIYIALLKMHLGSPMDLY